MRPTGGLFTAAVACVGAAEIWSRRTRPTRDERRMLLAGDHLVPQPMWQATRAVTIDATPEEVWPWLVQMGFPTHRAGWYTPYWLDRLLFGIRVRSADRILPQFQDLDVGDRVSDSPRGNSYFVAAQVDPAHALVLHSHTHPLPLYRDTDFSWAFVTERAGSSRTRLLMRARISYTPVWPAALVKALIVAGFGVGDVLQAGSMLLGIKGRAEGGVVMSRGELVIARPAEDVFDAVADETKPYDPRIVCAEKLTAGPIGLHTRFRSETRGFLSTVPMIVELTDYDRPRRLSSTTYLRGMEIESALTFTRCIAGTRMTWTMRAQPHGPLRLLRPLINRAGRRQARRIWTELKRALEHGDAIRTPTTVGSATQ